MFLSDWHIRKPWMANWLSGYVLSSLVSKMAKMSNLPCISQFFISWNLKPAMLLALIWPILCFSDAFQLVSKLVQVLLWSSFLFRVWSVPLQELLLVSILLTSAKGSCFISSKQGGHIQLAVSEACNHLYSFGEIPPHLIWICWEQELQHTALWFLATTLLQTVQLSGPGVGLMPSSKLKLAVLWNLDLVYLVWHVFTRWRWFAAVDNIRNIHTGLICLVSESDNTLRSLYSLPRRPGPSRRQQSNYKRRNKTVSTEPWHARVCTILIVILM